MGNLDSAVRCVQHLLPCLRKEKGRLIMIGRSDERHNLDRGYQGIAWSRVESNEHEP